MKYHCLQNHTLCTSRRFPMTTNILPLISKSFPESKKPSCNNFNWELSLVQTERKQDHFLSAKKNSFHVKKGKGSFL